MNRNDNNSRNQHTPSILSTIGLHKNSDKSIKLYKSSRRYLVPV